MEESSGELSSSNAAQISCDGISDFIELDRGPVLGEKIRVNDKKARANVNATPHDISHKRTRVEDT